MVGDRAVGSREPARGEPRDLAGGAPRAVVFGFLDLGEGGAQRLTLATCKELRRDRYRPRLLCARGDGGLVGAARTSGLEVRCLGRLRRPYDLGALPLLVGELRRLRPDILQVPLYSRASPYFRLAARLAGVRLVVAHEWSRPEPPPWRRRAIDRLLRARTRFIAASRAQQRDLLAAGVDAAAIAVVHAGIEVERFAGGQREVTRAALGLGDEALVVLVPARLHPAKGHTDLLAAWPAVLARAPRAVALCAGDGPLADSLTSRIRDSGLGASVRLLGHRESIPDLLAACDLVALPSRVEGLPSALLEAFAARRAVVATDVGGVSEALVDGREGRLVPAGEPEALATALAELLLDPTARHAMGLRGRSRVEREFGLAAATRRLEETWEDWLAEPKRSDRS